MNLNPEDVKRLYGKTFYLVGVSPESLTPTETVPAETPTSSSPPLPEEVPQPEPISPPSPYPFLEQGAWSNWKMKPQAQLSIILQESEFKDRALTTLLKEMIVQSGIDTQAIGFGVIPDGVPEVILTDMPTRYGIICYTFAQKLPKEMEVKGKTFFPAAPLTMMANDTRYRRAMEKLLARWKENYRE